MVPQRCCVVRRGGGRRRREGECRIEGIRGGDTRRQRPRRGSIETILSFRSFVIFEK
jgi:hypothetical protein